jgi:hypothetical protein
MNEIEAGRQAARILNDEVFKSAIQQADDSYIEMWRHARTPGERERAHALQAALAAVISELEVIVGRGDVEEARRDSQ